MDSTEGQGVSCHRNGESVLGMTKVGHGGRRSPVKAGMTGGRAWRPGMETAHGDWER